MVHVIEMANKVYYGTMLYIKRINLIDAVKAFKVKH